MEADHANKPKTLSYYSNGLNQLLRYERLSNAQLDQVDDELISSYTEWRRVQKKGKKNRKITVATVNREREVLRRMLRLAAEWKLIPAAPTIKRLEGELGRERVVTHEEERDYLIVAKQPLRDVAMIIVDAGMRPKRCSVCDGRTCTLSLLEKEGSATSSTPMGKRSMPVATFL